jgi:tRNA dimethylallyltransferase
MVAEGLVEEVQGLLANGYSPDLPSLSAIGYRQIIRYLQGKLKLTEAVAQIKHDTRVFVRRQANWFKPDDPAIHWFPISAGVVDEIEAVLTTWLVVLDCQDRTTR